MSRLDASFISCICKSKVEGETLSIKTSTATRGGFNAVVITVWGAEIDFIFSPLDGEKMQWKYKKERGASQILIYPFIQGGWKMRQNKGRYQWRTKRGRKEKTEVNISIWNNLVPAFSRLLQCWGRNHTVGGSTGGTDTYDKSTSWCSFNSITRILIVRYYSILVGPSMD